MPPTVRGITPRNFLALRVVYTEYRGLLRSGSGGPTASSRGRAQATKSSIVDGLVKLCTTTMWLLSMLTKPCLFLFVGKRRHLMLSLKGARGDDMKLRSGGWSGRSGPSITLDKAGCR